MPCTTYNARNVGFLTQRLRRSSLRNVARSPTDRACWGFARAFQILASTGLLSALLACSPIRGYPDNFADSDQNIDSLANAVKIDKKQYYPSHFPAPVSTSQPLSTAANADSTSRTELRNRIAFEEMQMYEIYFTRFQTRLWGDNNVISSAGDLIVFVLNGFGATTGTAATKSALAAASAGIIGAEGAISKDIYYQRTLPAVLAQMSANRGNCSSPRVISVLRPSRTTVDLTTVATIQALGDRTS